MSHSLWPHGLQLTRPPCPSLSPRVFWNSSALSVMPLNHLVLCCPFSSLNLSQHQGLFQRVGFGIRPKYWSFSFSIGPSNEYSGLFPLGLTGLISLLSKGLSRVFSSATVQKHQFFSAQLSLYPTLTSIHVYWKNHSFDYPELCWQSDVSVF